MNMSVPHAFLETPALSVAYRIAANHEYTFSPQLRVRYDRDTRALWMHWNPQPRPCFNPALLRDLRSFCSFMDGSEGRVGRPEDDCPIEYTVVASDVHGIFNLGGDLDLFMQLIESRDRAGLMTYGRACVDILYRNYVGYDRPITTISLVQGECLGGGFEAALSSDLVVAEKSARFGFPEILFNLFPGMGAYSFLERRVGRRATADLLESGRIYSADEMLAMGVIDAVAEDGQGPAEIAALVRRRARSRNGLQALATVRRRVNRSLDFDELLDVVGIWADAALRLTSRDLKLMQRLVTRQNGIGSAEQVH